MNRLAVLGFVLIVFAIGFFKASGYHAASGFLVQSASWERPPTKLPF